MSCTIKIYHHDKLEVEFNNEENDFKALKYLLDNQGQSADYAMRYGGWKVEIINEQTNESEFWKPYPFTNYE